MPAKPRLSRPNISLSQLKQVFFVLSEVFKISWKTSPRILSADLGLNLLWGFINLPTLYLSKLIIDQVIRGIQAADKTESIHILAVLLAISAIIAFIRTIISRAINIYEGNLSRRLSYEVSILLGKKNSELDIPTIESPHFKDKFSKVEREGGQRMWSLIPTVSDVPSSLMGIFTSLIIIFTFNPWIVIVITIVSFPQIFFSAKYIRKEYDYETIASPTYRLISWLNFFLSQTRNYFEQRILGNNQYLAQKSRDLSNQVITAKEKIRNMRVMYRAVGDFPGAVFLLIFNIWLFVLAIVGRMTLGTAQMLFNATTALQNNLNGLVNDFLTVYENYLYVYDLVWILNLAPKNTGGSIDVKTPFTQGIVFKDVWFKYPAAKNWIIKGVNLKADLKENLAIVGENGAGKTTLIKLLCGFYPVTKGEILVNGININQYDNKSYWKSLSILFQDFETYPFTARESIAYGDVNQINNFDRITEMANETDIHSFIDNLPKKYENPLAKEFESGVEPSKGQWQRIALSRTLFKNGEIVILDEPTSNVDPAAEEEIFDKVISLTKNKILILISHRFSTVRRADKIFVMDKGRIVESGTHDKLLKADLTYARLFNLQAKGYQ